MAILKKPYEIAVMDVETTDFVDGEWPKTLFWGFADKHGYKRFETTGQFIKFLLHDCEPRTIFFHTNFDVLVLINDGFYNMQFVKSHNGKLIAIRLGEHVLANSYAVFVSKLEDILTAFGYEKKPLHEIELRNYGDTVEARQCFINLDNLFNREFGVSPFDYLTIAATAFAAAEQQAGDLPKDLRFIEAYRGGRVDLFDTRETLCDKWDINSSYTQSFCEAPRLGNLLKVRVKSKDYYGPLFNADISERLQFPRGTFTSWVYEDVFDTYIGSSICNITILERTSIDLSWLRRVAPLGRKAFARKAEAKEKGDKGLEIICKYFLNAMYGRTGQRGISERCRILPYMTMKPGSTIIQMDWTAYLTFETLQTKPRANYAIASYITDNARGRIYSAICRTSAIYADTDCIVCPAGSRPDNIGSNLGEFKSEGTKMFKGNNLKHYKWGDAITCKGGMGKNQWTLRQVATGQPIKFVKKEHSLNLLKRELNEDGTTNPLEVNYEK